MTTRKVAVLVLFGGVSSEHEISRISGAAIYQGLQEAGYQVLAAGITRSGSWLLTPAEVSAIRDGSWQQHPGNRRLMVSLDRERRGLYAAALQAAAPPEQIPVDVIFPALHGKNGEDGTIQGLFDMAGIPYVGSGTTASAACMDKGITKALVDQAEAAHQARCCIVHRSGCDPQEAAAGVDAFFQGVYPLFVKPARAGSSVGITKVKRPEDLSQALVTAFQEDSKVLVEETIIGRELEVAVLGNEDPAASCVGEIFSACEFYDYAAKYENASSHTEIVTDLPQEKEREIRETALRIYRVLECRGLARVDFFLQEDGRLVFNEINTMPGFTEISMYPSLWEASGLPFTALIDALVTSALPEECNGTED